MALTVISPASVVRVTSLATVKAELGIVGSTANVLLDRYINEVTEYVRNVTGRNFPYQTYRESIRSPGMTTLLMVECTPLVSVDSVKLSTAAIGSSEYSVDDATAGFIYRENGWDTTMRRTHSITPQPLSIDQARPLWVVDYHAGYNMPELYDKPSTSFSTSSYSTAARRFPQDLEGVCIELVNVKWSRRGTDKSVKSQRTGDASETLFDGGLPPTSIDVLQRYTRAY